VSGTGGNKRSLEKSQGAQMSIIQWELKTFSVIQPTLYLPNSTANYAYES